MSIPIQQYKPPFTPKEVAPPHTSPRRTSLSNQQALADLEKINACVGSVLNNSEANPPTTRSQE